MTTSRFYLLLGLVLASHQASLAQSLLDYDVSLKDHPDSFSPGGSLALASSFTVGSQNVDVSSVGFILGSYNTPSSSFQCSAYIYSDNNGQPGSLIGSDQITLTGLSAPQFYDFTFSSALSLSAGETYWAAVGVPYPGSGPLYIGAAWDLRGFSDYGITPDLSLASSGYPPDSFGVSGTPETIEYRIAGNVVPEPGTFALCLTSALVAFVRLKRRQIDS